MFSVLPQTRSAVAVPHDGVLRLFGFSESGPFETSVFYYVPRNTETFGIRRSGQAVLRLFDGSGEAVLEHRAGAVHWIDAGRGQGTATPDPGDGEAVTVAAGDDQAGRVWWVQVTEAVWGGYSIALEGLPSVGAPRLFQGFSICPHLQSVLHYPPARVRDTLSPIPLDRGLMRTELRTL